MEHAPVVPDGDVVGVLPAQTHLDRVVLCHEVVEPLEEVVALLGRDVVDVPHVRADGEDALPARHRVRADHGVDGA